jgi:hypothetical protein
MSYRRPSLAGAWKLNIRTFITAAFAAIADPVAAVMKVTTPSTIGHHRQQVSSGWQPVAIPMAPQYRVVPLSKYYGELDPYKFFMCYEAAITSAGGDDTTLAKSFIISLENEVAN